MTPIDVVRRPLSYPINQPNRENAVVLNVWFGRTPDLLAR
jgi:hypothetical protein